jgi:hypothetical protein
MTAGSLTRAHALGSAVAPLGGWDFRLCHFIMRDSISGSFNLQAATGIRYCMDIAAIVISDSIINPLAHVALFFFLRILLRNQKAALALIVILAVWSSGPEELVSLGLALISSALFVYVLMHFGLLAAVTMYAYSWLLAGGWMLAGRLPARRKGCCLPGRLCGHMRILKICFQAASAYPQVWAK